MEFKKISLADYEKYSEYYKKCMMMCADTSFYGVWGSSLVFDTVQAFERGFYWHKVDCFGEELWLSPVGDWDSVNWEDVLTELVPAGTVFTEVPEYLVKKWQAFADKITIEDMRGSWDYVCNVKKYVDLSGRKYKSLRGAINKFERSYDYTFAEVRHADIADIKDFQTRWMQGNEGKEKMTEDLIMENQIIDNFLDNWGELPNIIYKVLRVDGKVVAYTVVEFLDENMLCIHLLKADRDYAQAAGFIQYMTFKELAGDYLLYNAWGDLDLEGLRNNKMGENPITLYKKYRVTWNG